MARKDETIAGLTGQPVPKPRSAKKQYELEKKRRQQKHLGKNVGGHKYSSDVNPYYNPRQRTFEQFMMIAEGKKKKEKSNLPPNADPDTYQELPNGVIKYKLKPTNPPNKPLGKKEVFKQLAKQGGIGGKAIEKAQKKAKKLEKQQHEGFSYSDREFQDKLEKTRKEKKQKEAQVRQKMSSDAHNERVRGRGIRATHKGQSGWMKDGKFTPD
jgi:hypothetical protein